MNEYKPYKENALTRVGKQINFWLSKRDVARLEELKKDMRMSYSDIFRYLLNNEYLNNLEERSKYLQPKK